MFSNDLLQICDCLLRNFPAAGFIIPASLEQSVFTGWPFFPLHNTDSEYVCEGSNGSLLEGRTIEPLVRAQELKWLENQISVVQEC